MARGPGRLRCLSPHQSGKSCRPLVRRRSIHQDVAMRARIVLACAEGQQASIAAALGVSRRPSARGASVSRRTGWRAEGCAPLRCAAADRGRGGRALIALTLETRRRRHALEHARDGAPRGHEPDRGVADLARLRPAAAPAGDIQALDRPAVRREGARHRRAVPAPAGSRAGAVRGREAPDPGARPARQPMLADAAGPARAADARLRAHGTIDLFAALDVAKPARSSATAIASPQRRVPRVPRRRSSARSAGPRCASGDGQLRHPQDAADPRLARQASALSRALHADQRLLAQSGRALVRR